MNTYRHPVQATQRRALQPGLYARGGMSRCQSQMPRKRAAQPQPPRNSYDMSSARLAEPSTCLPAQLTVVLMGGVKVGKSTLVNQFLWEAFIKDYRPTVEEFNWIEYDSEEGELVVQIIDSSGSRDFLSMRDLYYKTGNAFLVVYALDDPNSYSEAIEIMQQIQALNHKNAPILLIANKADIALPDQNGNDYARKNRIPYLNVSSKHLKEVQHAFWLLMDQLRMSCSPLEFQLRKRRQSMPSRRTANDLGIDARDLEQLVRKHDRSKRMANCVIS
ncbi:Ras family protein [Aphelenchoides bicaudatus]|nr:Ras family protein [Aphelenchoides bicaudatus]